MTAISLRGLTADAAPVSTSRTSITPTDEQAAAVDIFKTGQALVLEAGAGTGKTSTLKLLAKARPFSRGIYIAYNRAIADDAKASFPKTVTCATAHSFAYKDYGRRYRARLNGPRVPAFRVAEVLGCERVEVGDGRYLGRNAVARTAVDTVRQFCNSADLEPGVQHVPWVDGIDKSHIDAFRSQVAVHAKRAWADMQGLTGRLAFTHDCYLKLWQLDGPTLHADYVLLDEAQDANPVIADVVLKQNAQLIAVGDAQQAIYSWRGAVDAMRDWPAEHRLPLSQSFRFGPAIAREANVWLSALGADLRLRGFDRIASQVARLDEPDAVLCRTNMEAVQQAMTALEAGRRVAIVGGVNQIKALARAASDLKNGVRTEHPDLAAFESWEQVQDYVDEDGSAADLKVLVGLVDRYGVGGIFKVTDAVVDEPRAEVVVSTAHKAKGREWDSVRIANDFRPPKDGGVIERGAAMLAYVAVTRAKRLLDNGALEWARGFKVAPRPVSAS